MRPDSPKLHWDARTAAWWIAERTTQHSFAEYLNDELLRLSIERQFIIVGEALAQLARKDPITAQEIPAIRQIIGFRNILVHGYAEIDDELVWNVATFELKELIGVVDGLLSQ